MATRFCKWPAGDRAGAEAYREACDAAFAGHEGVQGAVWAVVRPDRNGDWIAPLFGPPWPEAAAAVVEPAACLAARAGAVVIETPDWPADDNA